MNNVQYFFPMFWKKIDNEYFYTWLNELNISMNFKRIFCHIHSRSIKNQKKSCKIYWIHVLQRQLFFIILIICINREISCHWFYILTNKLMNMFWYENLLNLSCVLSDKCDLNFIYVYVLLQSFIRLVCNFQKMHHK